MADNTKEPTTYRTPGEDQNPDQRTNAPPPERTNKDHPIGYGEPVNTANAADPKAADATAGHRNASSVVRESTRKDVGK